MFRVVYNVIYVWKQLFLKNVTNMYAENWQVGLRVGRINETLSEHNITSEGSWSKLLVTVLRCFRSLSGTTESVICAFEKIL